MKTGFAKFKTEVSEDLNKLRSNFAELRELLDPKLKEVDDLKMHLPCLEGKVRKLENTIDEGDTYKRRDTVIIAGTALPMYSQGEKCGAIVQKLVKDHLSFEIQTLDINTAVSDSGHFILGIKRFEETAAIGHIIVKFCCRHVKSILIMASKRRILEIILFHN